MSSFPKSDYDRLNRKILLLQALPDVIEVLAMDIAKDLKKMKQYRFNRKHEINKIITDCRKFTKNYDKEHPPEVQEKFGDLAENMLDGMYEALEL